MLTKQTSGLKDSCKDTGTEDTTDNSDNVDS